MAILRTVGETTLTGKNQISLPASGVRQLGWERGDRLFVRVLGDDAMLLTRRPSSLTDYYAGRVAGAFGSTHEEIIRYIAEERASWEPAVNVSATNPDAKSARQTAPVKRAAGTRKRPTKTA
jgi:hypothetical protein